MKKFFTILAILLPWPFFVKAQGGPAWDNTRDKHWGPEFTRVQIPCSADGSLQQAWYHQSAKKSQPLIVSLHTWSGDYNQEDPLANEVLLRDWNYIHPDFRGPNNRPQACGSPLVLSDLLDAIRFAVKESGADSTEVHIVGVSGGGYLTLLAYMKLPYPVRSFNAWAPISDLRHWYWESKGRHNKYADDLENVAMRPAGMDWETLNSRSPLRLPIPQNRDKAELRIYEGIHDGYTGSVPITHSILFYNKIVAAEYPDDKQARMPDSVSSSLLIRQCNPEADSSHRLGGRMIHWQQERPGIGLTLFEGGHEMLVGQALALLPIHEVKNLNRLRIVTIGDSNGAFDFGWPQQLKKLLPWSVVINHSIAGNTIGFDNLGRPELNTLKNIDSFLLQSFTQLRQGESPDWLIIGLGTNDTKKVFASRQTEVSTNLDRLLSRIEAWFRKQNLKMPKLLLVTPPPMDEKQVDPAKYGGGDKRIQENNQAFALVARKHGAHFVDSYSLLKPGFSSKTLDGIHLKPAAQFELAEIIVDYINHN